MFTATPALDYLRDGYQFLHHVDRLDAPHVADHRHRGGALSAIGRPPCDGGRGAPPSRPLHRQLKTRTEALPRAAARRMRASEMSWRTRFRRRENLLESLWVVPLLGASSVRSSASSSRSPTRTSGPRPFGSTRRRPRAPSSPRSSAQRLRSPASSSPSPFSSCRWRPGRSRPASCASGTATAC